MVKRMEEPYAALMDGCSVHGSRCAACGADGPLVDVRVVPDGCGALVRHGVRMQSPTVSLCHDCAKAKLTGTLHLRWVREPWRDFGGRAAISGSFKGPGGFDAMTRGGHWERLRTARPCRYEDALERDGWRRLGKGA